MSMSKKQEVIKAFQKKPSDTGSSAVQIALLTHKMEELNAHLKIHPKDLHSRRGLLKQVNARRSALDYLKRTSFAEYQEILQKLGLRR
jgi:small subunit ribosomal protein S15